MDDIKQFDGDAVAHTPSYQHPALRSLPSDILWVVPELGPQWSEAGTRTRRHALPAPLTRAMAYAQQSLARAIGRDRETDGRPAACRCLFEHPATRVAVDELTARAEAARQSGEDRGQQMHLLLLARAANCPSLR
ncbi:hypothetical protein AB0O82_10600 [Kitasatospora sp. NPDC088264]|uniref:hypothetical protein n=1 Tax=Kitasatospora sp. NPDC088264 TaxID=3155296 RepID=UPI00344475C0